MNLKDLTIGEAVLLTLTVGLVAFTGYAIYDSIIYPSANTCSDVQYYPIIIPIP